MPRLAARFAKARGEGALAYFAGKPKSSNPYTNPSERGAWTYGWNRACREDPSAEMPTMALHDQEGDSVCDAARKRRNKFDGLES